MKILNKKSITVYTIIILILSMFTFEIGYCNSGLVNGESTEYNFSLCRIVIYILFIAIYIFAHKKFVETAEKTTENKFKRIFIYLASILGICVVIGFAIYSQNVETSYVRACSIGTIIVLHTILFTIYVSNDIGKNIIITSCTFGIIFTFSTPFNHAIDEKKHFMSALNISFGNLDYTNNPVTDPQIEELPQLSSYTTIDEFLKNDYEKNVVENDTDDMPSTPASYDVFTYIFPAIGILIARVLNGSIIDMYILGRIMNLVLYTCLVYIALKILPYKKNIFYINAFMPYMLLLAASYSADGLCLGTLYIFIAYCLKLHKECETISLKQFLILVALFAITLIGKGVGYICTGILVFLLPLSKTIKKNKKYIPIMVTIAIIFVIIATFFVIYMRRTKITSDGDSRGEGYVNANDQLEMVLTHPIYDVKIALEHIRVTLLNFNWLATLHQDTFFGEGNLAAFLLMMLFVLYVSLTEDDINFKIKDKIVLFLAFFLCYCMTSVVLYLTFTAVGELHIAGYQARYLFPILPLLLCCISNYRVKCYKSKNRNMSIGICSGIFLAIGIIQLVCI